MEFNYTNQYIKKIHDFHHSLALIRIRPQDRDAHINLYQHYLSAENFITKKISTNCVIAGSLGPFHFVDTIFDATTKNHEFTMQYFDEEITISSKNNFHVMESKYINTKELVQFENNYYQAIMQHKKLFNVKELYFPNREN